METVIRNPLKSGERITDLIFSARGAYHMLFWAIVLLILTIVEGTRHGFVFTITNELITIFFFGPDCLHQPAVSHPQLPDSKPFFDLCLAADFSGDYT